MRLRAQIGVGCYAIGLRNRLERGECRGGNCLGQQVRAQCCGKNQERKPGCDTGRTSDRHEGASEKEVLGHSPLREMDSTSETKI